MKFIILAFFISFASWAKLPALIKVCDDGAEWPPYIYYQKETQDRTKKIVGDSLTYLKLLLYPKGVQIKIKLLPWTKCLEGVRKGEYDLVLNASFNAERNRSYYFTRAYYKLTPTYFFDQTQLNPEIKKISDLKKFKLCGVAGYNYQSGFLLSSDDLNMSSSSIAEALKKIKSKECQIVPERLEIVVAYKKLGIIDYEKLGLSYHLVPEATPIPFHMLISKAVPYGGELVEYLNDAIKMNSFEEFQKKLR